jgi:hypothetical protein
MTQYEDQRWVEHFQMTKEVMQLMEKLRPLIEKKTQNIDKLFRLALKLYVHCTNWPIELIIPNAMKCLQSASHL